MEVCLGIFVLFVGNFALLEAKTPLVIGKYTRIKFVHVCFVLEMTDVLFSSSQLLYQNRSGLEYYAYFSAEKMLDY